MQDISTHGNFNLGIGAILENIQTRKVLLLKRNPKMYGDENWDDVGGRMRQNETLEICLVRELREETGIEDFQIRKIIDAFRYVGDDINYQNMIVISYWCQTDIQEVKLSNEHTNYNWVKPETALELKLNPHLKHTIKRFIQERDLEEKNR
ncbi:MAG: NUDIX domain-containing protein [Candidatus Kariarchaeaceae archaeon]